MSLKEDLQIDLNASIQSERELPSTVLQSVINVVNADEQVNKIKHTDKQVLDLISTEVEKRRAIIERLIAEVDFISAYLPVPLTIDEEAILVLEGFASN